MKESFFLLLLLYGFLASGGAFILDTSATNRTIVKVLSVPNAGQWGEWGIPDFCPVGYYANGFRIKLEGNQGDGDDTAMNGVRLSCRDKNQNPANDAISGSGPWGNWLAEVKSDVSQNKYLMAFQTKVESPQGFGDDTAMDFIQFLCREFYGGPTVALTEPSQDIGYGDWGHYSAQCPKFSAICGLSTKVEKPQNIGNYNQDDTALNDVVFYCCSD